jgi:hypothetical protein
MEAAEGRGAHVAADGRSKSLPKLLTRYALRRRRARVAVSAGKEEDNDAEAKDVA